MSQKNHFKFWLDRLQGKETQDKSQKLISNFKKEDKNDKKSEEKIVK